MARRSFPVLSLRVDLPLKAQVDAEFRVTKASLLGESFVKRLATSLATAGGLALMLVDFTPNSSLAWAWGWRYYPCYGGHMYHYPYAYLHVCIADRPTHGVGY
jgi:hypothetical protein